MARVSVTFVMGLTDDGKAILLPLYLADAAIGFSSRTFPLHAISKYYYATSLGATV